jgi:conjugative transfer signal peptidase TraF
MCVNRYPSECQHFYAFAAPRLAPLWSRWISQQRHPLWRESAVRIRENDGRTSTDSRVHKPSSSSESVSPAPVKITCGTFTIGSRPATPLHTRAASRPASAQKDRPLTRFRWVMTTSFAALSIGLSALFHPEPRLLWNVSASVPMGLYAVHPAGALHVGELLIVAPPEPLASLLDQRRYLPKGVPLLKHILALPSQTVCRTEPTIIVDGLAIGVALDKDHLGRLLPVWHGCRLIAAGQVFLMNRQSPDSFDGRYFGPLPTIAIVGRAEPLWTHDKD